MHPPTTTTIIIIITITTTQASYTATLAEDVQVGTAAVSVRALDADSRANGRVLYSITGGDPYSQFTVDFATGALTIKAALDYENTTAYTLIITAADQGSPSRNTTVEVRQGVVFTFLEAV